MAWLPGYSKRQPVVLTGGASGAQTDFQLKLAVPYEAAMDGEFDDLRFTQADGTTLVDAWAELIVTDTSATVWVEFPTTPANTVEQTYYMYYDHATPVSDWDGAATFIAYHGATLTDFVDSLLVTPNNIVYEARGRTASASHALLWGLANNATGLDDYMMVYSKSGDNLRINQVKNDGASANVSEAPALSISTWYKIKQSHDGSIVRAYVDDNEIASGVSTNLPNETLGLWMYSPTGTAEQDWSFVRKYAANPPTYEFGAEESDPGAAAAPTSIFYGPFVGPFGGPI